MVYTVNDMLTRGDVEAAIQRLLDRPEIPSTHLRPNRWVFTSKRVLTEMLLIYRPLGDRDGDATFIPSLIELGISDGLAGIISCPFERDKSENRIARYDIKLTNSTVEKLETIRDEKGWTVQRLMANAAYTGLLKSYPEFLPEAEFKMFVPEYKLPGREPNIYWLQFQGEQVKILEKDNRRDPWVKCLVKGKELDVRKDWLFSLGDR
jgi:hypothetical protein